MDRRRKKQLSPPPSTIMIQDNVFTRGEHNAHAFATPLFELTSIAIRNHNFKQFTDFKIYGTIILVDDLGSEFYIFNCKRDDAKTVILNHKCFFSTILRKFELGTPRCLPAKFWLLFQLKRLHDAEDFVILDDCKYIDCTTEDVCYDKLSYKSCGSVVVNYSIFMCASVADVGVVVEKIGKDGEDRSECAELRIIAVNKLLNFKKPLRRVLFAGSQDFGNFTVLSTLAVPVYSTLEILGQVLVNGEAVSSGISTFEPHHAHSVWYEKQIAGKYRIRVMVCWRLAIKSLPEADILEWCVDRTSKISGTDKRRPTSNIHETKTAIYIPKSLKQCVSDWFVSCNKYKIQLMEIFSISVCAYDRGLPTSSLKGFIECFDRTGSKLISNSVTLNNGIVKLVPDLGRAFRGSYLGVVTELKYDLGYEISCGFLAYDFVQIKGWLDRRICSVIRGQDGFLAVHYSIFRDAVVAKLLFRVISNFAPDAAGCRIHGRINAWYSNYGYSTHYEKEYFRMALFEKQDDDVLKLSDGEIPLSKSVIAVPVTGNLVVGGSVYALSGNQKKKLEFEETLDPFRRFGNIFEFEKPFSPEESDGLESRFSLWGRVEWVHGFEI